MFLFVGLLLGGAWVVNLNVEATRVPFSLEIPRVGKPPPTKVRGLSLRGWEFFGVRSLKTSKRKSTTVPFESSEAFVQLAVVFARGNPVSTWSFVTGGHAISSMRWCMGSRGLELVANIVGARGTIMQSLE